MKNKTQPKAAIPAYKKRRKPSMEQYIEALKTLYGRPKREKEIENPRKNNDLLS